MILDQIVADKKIRLEEHKKNCSLQEMRNRAEERIKKEMELRQDCFFHALQKPGLSIIGECKKASPSLGNIQSHVSIEERIRQYSCTVDAISCLTEEDHFQGSASDLEHIRPLTGIPILRKDFMIDAYQFYEAKAIGADAVLLIAAILDDVQLRDYYQLARELQLDVLIETHDEKEMERALAINPRIIGVNNRNLKDFTIDLTNSKRLSQLVPKDKVMVAESGIVSTKDIVYLAENGIQAVLIGRAFMEAKNPKETIESYRKAYREMKS